VPALEAAIERLEKTAAVDHHEAGAEINKQRKD
jgi:hypothetical protein